MLREKTMHNNVQCSNVKQQKKKKQSKSPFSWWTDLYTFINETTILCSHLKEKDSYIYWHRNKSKIHC